MPKTIDPIERNVREAITRMKRSKTTGASMDCLFSNTRTTGVTVPVGVYRSEFERIATNVAKAMRFELY